jgi:hypothetical protein
MDLHKEASLIIGLRLPDDPMHWEPFLKERSTGGSIDQNKKWNLIIMLMMRVNALERKVAELTAK